MKERKISIWKATREMI